MKLFKKTILIILLTITTINFAQNDDINNDFNKDITNIKKVYDAIIKLYVDKVNTTDLFDNAIKGMVGGLDPHSQFLKPNEQKNLAEHSSGKFGGLGIVINKKDDLIEIISPIDDTPAFRKGLKSNDLILKIDDKSVRGMSIEEAVKLMRGEPKTSINLTILRKNEKPFVVNIVRDIITIVSAKGYLLEPDLAYIRISSFQSPTKKLLIKTLNNLKEKNKGALKSIILDLRNNPGGLLKGATEISDIFLEEDKIIVYTEGRINGSNTTFHSKTGDMTNGAKMVVLINSGSASASEIVAGALKDHKRAIIIGQQSFGKGSVQSVIELPNGYGIKITTAIYYTPNGFSLQSKGITPDITLKNIQLKEDDKSEITIDIKEIDLKNHIKANGKAEDKDKDKDKAIEYSKKDQKNINNLKKDYFIHEATVILKALNILDKDIK